MTAMAPDTNGGCFICFPNCGREHLDVLLSIPGVIVLPTIQDQPIPPDTVAALPADTVAAAAANSPTTTTSVPTPIGDTGAGTPPSITMNDLLTAIYGSVPDPSWNPMFF